MKEKNLLLTHENSENVITSEGVILKTEPLPLPNRILAFIIDSFFNVVIFIMLILTLFNYADIFIINANAVQTVYIISITIVFFVIPILIETITCGYSIGKYIIGARVVREDGGAISFRHVFTRHLVGVVEVYGSSGIISITSIAVAQKGKRLGDYLAGTYLAKNPSYISHLPLIMPKEFEQWANQVNISRIPESIMLEAKSFINRTNNLSPHIRQNFANNISNTLLKYVDLNPGENFDKERFIAAVLVVKRDDEFRKILLNRKHTN